MDTEKLAGAARYLDHLADTHKERSLQMACEQVGLPFDDMKYICEQRAMRTLLLVRGKRVLSTQRMTKYNFSPQDRLWLGYFFAASVDALLIGLAADKGLFKPFDDPNKPSSN